jgi:hypothetical protein
MVEPKIPQSGLHVGLAFRCHQFEDDIDIIGWSRRNKIGIVEQEVDNGSADESVGEANAVEPIGDGSQGPDVRRRH